MTAQYVWLTVIVIAGGAWYVATNRPVDVVPEPSATRPDTVTVQTNSETVGIENEERPGLIADCPDALTPPQAEGPYYKGGSPERTSLQTAGVVGDPLVVQGVVFDQDCQPIAGVRLDFWQADGRGMYDNTGYNLRGHQFTDEAGRYELVTVQPAQYPGRTPHIHVKAQPPGGRELTSQLYFPGEARNTADAIFNPALEVTMVDNRQAEFHFKL